MKLSNYIGLPYADKGRGPAYDCIGFIRHVYQAECGIELPNFLSTYQSSEDRDSVANAVEDQMPKWDKVDHPRPLDVILFNILGYPIHVGLYLTESDFLHCYRNTNSCIERLDSVTWNRRINGIYRWIG